MVSTQTEKKRAQLINKRLGRIYPGTVQSLCALTFSTPFQLLCATILSAQCTDQRVNEVVPLLFGAYPDAPSLARADVGSVESIIRSTGFFRSKAANLISMANGLLERFDGEVPRALEDLVTLAGVGRKTANVVRSVAFDLPGLPVDTHVGRLARRLGLSDATDPVAMEMALNALIPPKSRGIFSLRLILHGRAVCSARTPKCDECILSDICPSAHRVVVNSAKKTSRRSE